MNNIIFFGPPGAGKGTQAKIISEYLKLPHLSTGEILRSKTKQEDSLAIQLRAIMARGDLVSDDILNQIISERLSFCKDGFILDGYPRTLDQAKHLNNFLSDSSQKIDYIFNIDINFDILKKRILKRSKEENREDDNIDAIKIRYDLYTKTTKEVSEYYKELNRQIFNEINGNEQIHEITTKIKKILKN